MKVINFQTDLWAQKSAELIFNRIIGCIEKYGFCSVFLTGGRSAKLVYRYLSELLPAVDKKVDFFIGDERCVADIHVDSNYGMIYDTLFKNLPTGSYNLYKFYFENLSYSENINNYCHLLPVKPHIILLGLGDDGHVASLFPGNEYLDSFENVIQTTAPNGKLRLTLTLEYINLAEEIFVFAKGEEKKQILNDLSLGKFEKKLPISLVKNPIFLCSQ